MSPNRVLDVSKLEQFTAINLLVDPGATGGPIVVPSCAQAVLHFSLTDGKAATCVLYGAYASSSVVSVAVAQALFLALTSGGAWTGLQGALVTTFSFTGVTLRDVNVANQPVIASTGTAVNGTNVAAALPNEMAICVTKRTALAGRANRGRMYVPGFATDALAAGGVINPGTIGVLQTWVNTFISLFAGQGLTLSLGLPARAAYTGETGTAHPARAAHSVPITQMLVRDNHWDSQRRRGLK